MQVDSSSLNLASAHIATDSLLIEERMEVRRMAVPAQSVQSPQDMVDISDPKLLLAKLLFKVLTGNSAGVVTPARQAAVQQQVSISYSRREIHQETESTSFAAEGTVTLKSGETIKFSLNLQMNRELTEINEIGFQAGNMKDPIVVNLDGIGARLTGEREAFDLNGDGVDETIATLAAGSAWLARDTNANGEVDSGLELFGPASGNGFGELAALDGDGNGWIDEGDSAFAALGLWSAGVFTSLSEAGIGALSTASVATPFTLEQGRIRDSGIYLRENGTPGALQQIDFVA